MKTYVALLRGINVGGNSKVSMSELKKAFERCGHEGASTYINSGNVIFSAEDFDTLRVERELEKTFGFRIPLVIRDMPSMRKIDRAIPRDWTNDAEQKTDILFLRDDFDSKKSVALLRGVPKIDNLKYVSGAIVWNIKRSDYGKSAMNKFIGSVLYKNMTARNVNTVRTLVTLMEKGKSGRAPSLAGKSKRK